MPRRSGPPVRRYACLFSRLFLERIALVAVILAGSFSARQSLAYAQAAGQQTAAVKHGSAKPKAEITGTDGSQTGIADFLGNFTTITAPSGQALGLAREPDCSLMLVTGSYSIGTGVTYTLTGYTDNYERVLHSEAALTTTPDVFASGCVAPTMGIGSREGVFAGTTTTGINVFAAAGYSPSQWAMPYTS